MSEIVIGVDGGGSKTRVMIRSANTHFELEGADTSGRLYVPIRYHGSRSAPDSFLIQFTANVANQSPYFVNANDFRMQPIRSDAEAEALIDFSI